MKLPSQRTQWIVLGSVAAIVVPLRFVTLPRLALVDVGLDAIFLSVGVRALAERLRALPEHWRSGRRNTPYVLYALAELLLLFPFATAIHLSGSDLETKSWLLFKLLSLPRVRYVRESIDSIEGLHPVFARLIPLTVVVPLIVHMCACGWILLGSGNTPGGNWFEEYVRGIYWAITTLATVGYGDITAKTPLQMLYASLVMVLGVGFFGYVLSNVASLLARLDHAREQHMSNLDDVEAFMAASRVPIATRLRVRAYYKYLWESRKGVSSTAVLNHLPSNLHGEIALHLAAGIVQKVPLFRDAEVEFVEDVVRKLEPRVCVPSERLFHAGEPGEEMYFIQRGEVEIILPDGRSIVTLGAGSFFGEMALVLGSPRNATAIARSYGDLFVLRRDAFESVLRRYPDFDVSIRRHVEEIQAARAAETAARAPEREPETERSPR